MKILTDENIPLMTVEALNALGHDVSNLHDVSRKGMKDTPVWSLAQTEKRLLITTDKGFARHRGEEHFGILIIRLKKPNLQKIHDRVRAALTEFPEEDWPGLLVTMRDAARGVWRKKPS